MKQWVYLLPLVLFIALAIVLWQGLSNDSRLLPAAMLNQPFPEFALPSLASSSQIITTKDLPKQIILVNVWATWCSSCLQEHPFLVELAKQGVVIIGLNYKDKRADALAWLKQLGNPYQLEIFDAKGSLGLDLGVYGAPETYLLDQHGVIQYRHVGVLTPDVWRQRLIPIIEVLKNG